MTLPNFLCIGAQKAGTSWLFQMLVQNPDVWLPPIKELHFFDRRSLPEASKLARLEKLQKMARRSKRDNIVKGSMQTGQAELLQSLASTDIYTESWYRRAFSHPDIGGRKAGDFTPAYLAIAEEDVAYAKSLMPDARIILLVRSPLARSLSQVKMDAYRLKQSVITDEDWKRVIDNVELTRRGDYKTGIPLWQKYFGDQLLIIPFSSIRDEPAETIRLVENFLGIEAFQSYQAMGEPAFKTKEVAVPDWVADRVSELTRSQDEYLMEAFGADFLTRTK